MPTLVVSQPQQNATIHVGVPFVVAGQAWDVLGSEPHLIDSVTVRVDNGPVVEAALTPIHDQTRSLVSFTATATVTGGSDPHVLTVIATNDTAVSRRTTITLFAGPIFQPTAPAVLLELHPSPFAPTDPRLDKIVRRMQKGLLPLAGLLSGNQQILIGPHIIIIQDPQGINVLRLGLWIEDAAFPTQPPSPPDYPLPRLFPDAVNASMALADLLETPHVIGVAPAFALSVPMRTLQKILDALAPGIKAAAKAQHVTVEQVRVTGGDHRVETTISGYLPIGLSFEVSATEVLGLSDVPNANPAQKVPAVVGRDHSSSVGGTVLWLISGFFPLIRLGLFAVWGYVAEQAGDTSEEIDGMVAPLLAGLPARVPFSNTDVPIPESHFPAVVMHWESLDITADRILGAGASEFIERDPAHAAIDIVGPRLLQGAHREFSGGVPWTDGFVLIDTAPDSGKLTWALSGGGQDGGVLDPGPFNQGGNIDLVFPLPLNPALGDHAFTLTVNAVETCGTDATKVIRATGSMNVTVRVLKDPDTPPTNDAARPNGLT